MSLCGASLSQIQCSTAAARLTTQYYYYVQHCTQTTSEVIAAEYTIFAH